MRSVGFFTILGLFPVLISGFPFLRRDSNDTSISTSNPTSVPINSTSSTAPTSTNTTDSSSNSTSTSTSSVAPTATSTNTTVPSSSNSTSTTAGSDAATKLLTLNLLTAKTFYEQAGAISQGLNDLNASTILGLNDTAGGVNCTFDLHTVLDASNTKNLISAVVYLESIKLMGAAHVLSNASFELDQTEQDTVTGIYQDSSQFSALAVNITDPTVPMGNHPNLTLEDYASILYKFNPSCRNDLGIPSITTHIQEGYSVPYQLSSGFVIGVGNEGCPNQSAQAFCQMVGPGTNATFVTPIVGNANCSMRVTPGPNLFFVTQVDTPLSGDPVERQSQEGDICSGPDVYVVNPL
ncbi:hypothetical protein Clacol_001929 [Clathrus columnatus]|uniref:Uncharacterized protein n=1 Tax=Clathrus columnatus TaxID=1419009 RepID=A0AAV4ZZE3_9AGAM|nr:hypothetical protein Clacol_001929 [Clathrus columnatus]